MRRWLRLGRVAPAALLVVSVGAAAACEPAPCVEPYAPALAVDATAGGQWLPAGVERPAPTAMAFDTDGDGELDTSSETEDRGVVVHRGSGDLVLDAPDPWLVSGPQPLGDLDGDGHSDVAVGVGDVGAGLYGYYLVPGSLPDGAHDPRDVGVLLAAGTSGGSPLPPLVAVPDLDGDGHDDLVVERERWDGSWVTEVRSGTDVWGARPGGALTGPPAATYPGSYEGVFTAGPGVNGLMTRTWISGGVEIRLVVRGAVRVFTSAGSPVEIIDLHYWRTWIFDGTDGGLLLVHHNGGRTSTVNYAWDLRDLCAGAGAAAAAAAGGSASPPAATATPP